ncbi:unnamed protein product [Effrenium voratum]|nr:unnamed protein product [Effrenium voratum]|mmetsp:Transcript_19112/g.45298  ORF Transcript_19112/g.45298 Transcript_19112/m.45298 type:complete len:225 (+) Transcript_19112:85-759(+)|eukprot:CAMPEP_0181461496 /NCGR_PEP_ID=MMETSP1110-20121109/33909_1 /TAXON_ID=174948 /ORGANISM="Symbiodinium sp., Strain CCMP421" /LENGTH=224 /DNA_ID=CAMNT_0023586125 /DNA_START=68 /DNA_END=742 /DNA_ORIENTATION=-
MGTKVDQRWESPMKVELSKTASKLCLTSSSDEDEPYLESAVAKLVKQDGRHFVAQASYEVPGGYASWADQLAALPGMPCLPNQGSIGHPEMCKRPCVYVSAYRTPCPNGAMCSYCHMTHSERRTTLDKRQREFLRRLGEPDLITILLPHFQAKLVTGKVPAAAVEVIRFLERRKGHSFLEAPDSLDAVLGQMSFSWLVSLLPFNKEPEFAQCLSHLQFAYATGA